MNKHTFMKVPRNVKMEGEANNVASLNWTIISKAVIDATEEEFAPLTRFSLKIEDKFYTEGSSVSVEVIDGVGEARKNIDNWNTSDLKTSKVSVSLDRISRPVCLTYDDRKNGVELVNKVKSIIRSVARRFWMDVMQAIADSGAEVVNVGPRKSFTPEIVSEDIWPSMTNGADALYLDRMYYSKLIPTTTQGLNLAAGAYSIDGGIHFVEGTNVLANNTGVGFASRPDALAVALALPVIPKDLGIRTEVFTSEKLGISILIKYWADQGSETLSMSAELMAGVKVCNKNHLRQLSSAPIVTEEVTPAVANLEGASVSAPAPAPAKAKTAKATKSTPVDSGESAGGKDGATSSGESAGGKGKES